MRRCSPSSRSRRSLSRLNKLYLQKWRWYERNSLPWNRLAIHNEFAKRNAVVLGVSADSESSHVKFKEKYGLPFTLLADEDHSVSEAYGVWVEKNMAGKRYMGIERSTFVIDADGNVAKVMRRVKPDTHADQVLAVLP